MVPFFKRPKGKVMREMVEEGHVDEIFVYSVTVSAAPSRICASSPSFLHERSVCLSIENMGINPWCRGRNPLPSCS